MLKSNKRSIQSLRKKYSFLYGAGGGGGPVGNFLLLESGDRVLQENDDRILLESAASSLKITELNEATDVVDADLNAMVDDPSGSPETQKVTVSNAFLRWGFRKTVSPPVSTDFAWVNQETATVSDGDAGMYMYVPNVAGDDARLLVKTIPSSPYTVTCGMVTASFEAGWHSSGIVLRDSSSGNFIIFGLISPSARTEVIAQKWTDPNSTNGNYSNFAASLAGNAVWWRVEDNNTNRIFSWSVDGLNFMQFYSVSRTDYITPNQIGVFGQANNGTYDLGITTIDWSEE